MTRQILSGIMTAMVVGTHVRAQTYSVELEPDTAKRNVILIDQGPVSAELRLTPQMSWKIGGSHIAAQDTFLWYGPYGYAEGSNPQSYLHCYRILKAYSSREYVKVSGNLVKDGPGDGQSPWFRVTVPSADIDWDEYSAEADEAGEDARKVFCPVTSDMSKRRKLIIRNPLDSGRLRDDDSLTGSSPDMVISLNSGYAGCFRLQKADGNVFNTGAFSLSGINSWPLELYVDAIADKPQSDFTITLEGPYGPGGRAKDKIMGTTIIKVVFDRVENADEIGTLTSGVTVYATSKSQGDVIVYLKTEPADMPLPPGTIAWYGGSPGNNQLERRVSRSQLKESGEFVSASVSGQPQIFMGQIYVFRAAPQATLATLTETQCIDNGLCRPEDFGRTDFDRTALTAEPQCGIYYEAGCWRYVFESMSYEIGWDLYDRGRKDVPSASANPFPLGRLLPANSTETEKKQCAKDDLKPLPVVPDRWSYWSSNIAEEHEKFHMQDYRNYYTVQLRAAETTFENKKQKVTLGNLDPEAEIRSQTDALLGEIKSVYQQNAWRDFSSNGRHEAAAENHVKPAYQTLSDAIQP